MNKDSAEISRLEQANVLGLAYLRTIVLLNGGAILAVLTLAGNAREDTLFFFSLASIKAAMWAFLIGITSVLIALLFSYSYTASAPETGWRNFWDQWIIRFNSVLALAAIVSFVFGVSMLIMGAASAP